MMNRKQYTTDLRDEEWAVLVPYLGRLLPEHERGRKPKYGLRLLIDAVRYVLRNGCTWRDLPGDFPPLAERVLPLCNVARARLVAQTQQALATQIEKKARTPYRTECRLRR